MARAQRLWTKACWTPRVLTLRSPRYANGVVALRRRSGMPSRGRKGAVRVESLPAASGRQLSQKRRDQALRLLAEARELLLGQQSATFQRRDPPQRSGTAQVVEQTSHFFLALVEEAIDNDIPLVGAKARVPVKPFAILQPALAARAGSPRWQNRSSATACNCRKIFQSDSLISRIIALLVVTLSPHRQKLKSLRWRTLALMKPGDYSIPTSGLLNPKIAHLRQRPSTGGGDKPAIFNLWSAGWAGTAFGLRTAALSPVTPIVERPSEKGEV